MRSVRIGGAIAVLIVAFLFSWSCFQWFVNRIYVHEGYSLLLRYKGPLIFGSRIEREKGQFAKEGEIGVLEQLRGPGRHFYCPIWWEHEIVPDTVVEPGQVAIVTSKMGDPLPEGQFLVDGDLGTTKHNGIMRKVFGPGRYRVNSYAYEFKIVATETVNDGGQIKHSGWVEIPAGYVGVVTYLADDEETGKKAGLQEHVLPPGLYPVNQHVMHVDIVEIGYRELSIYVTKQQTPDGKTLFDKSGEPLPVPKTGINFPSTHGFDIQMDFTAIWGVMPEHSAKIIGEFGTIEAVEKRVIEPQSESNCRINGSKLGAVDLLIGESRQELQDTVSKEFESVLEEKNLSLLYGLIRHIYIPQDIRFPLQQSFVADELKLTREQEKLTAETEADLREAEQKVELEGEKIRIETKKMLAAAKAEGEKTAAETKAETQQLVAAIDKEIANIDAKKQILKGQATAGAEKILQEAKSDKFALAVQAFGASDAFTKWQFADGLPKDIDLKLFYAGEGTLWTDLKGVLPTLPLRQPKPRP